MAGGGNTVRDGRRRRARGRRGVQGTHRLSSSALVHMLCIGGWENTAQIHQVWDVGRGILSALRRTGRQNDASRWCVRRRCHSSCMEYTEAGARMHRTCDNGQRAMHRLASTQRCALMSQCGRARAQTQDPHDDSMDIFMSRGGEARRVCRFATGQFPTMAPRRPVDQEVRDRVHSGKASAHGWTSYPGPGRGAIQSAAPRRILPAARVQPGSIRSPADEVQGGLGRRGWQYYHVRRAV